VWYTPTMQNLALILAGKLLVVLLDWIVKRVQEEDAVRLADGLLAKAEEAVKGTKTSVDDDVVLPLLRRLRYYLSVAGV